MAKKKKHETEEMAPEKHADPELTSEMIPEACSLEPYCEVHEPKKEVHNKFSKFQKGSN